ncbi:MAG: hypothetical protein QGG58_02860 [Chloroflexota bacterium]|nr:hypothetical protein [Chloroflexota bacterium]
MIRIRARAQWLGVRPALLVFIFLVSFYSLTMGVNRTGYGYSPDGTFAFEMAKSLVTDGRHDYFRQYYRNFSRWGIGMPVMLTPFVAFAEPLSDIAPERDRLPIDGEEYFLTYFPALSHPSMVQGDGGSELGLQIPPLPITELNLVSHSGLSVEMPQGTEIASLRIVEADGRAIRLPIRVGIETAEWAYERADVQLTVQHKRAIVVGKHIGNTRANYYFAGFKFAEPIDPVTARLSYTGPPGYFFVDAVSVRAAGTGELISFPGQGRIWSERQNKEFFLRFWAPLLSVLLTAATAAMVVKITRRLGYGIGVAVGIGLSFGLATMAWPFAKLDFAEPGVVFFLVAATLALLKYGESRRQRWALFASLLVLGAVFTKYVAVITLPVFALQLVLLHRVPGSAWRELPRLSWRAVLVFASPYLLLLLPGMLVLSAAYDFRLLYESELLAGLGRGWLGVPLWLGLWGLLFSWGKGFFLYNPIMWVAVPVAVWFVRRHGFKSLLFVAIPLAYLAIYSKKEVWYGGNTWGPRYLLPAIPFLMVMAAPAYRWVLARRGRGPAMALGLLLAGSVLVQTLGVAKDFDLYLSLYVDEIVEQLPEHGVEYGGREYQQWSSIQPEGDLAAVLYSYQFSPLLAHVWLLRADAIELLLPDRLDLVEEALVRTPWARFGVEARAQNPQNATGLDLWSFIMWANYYNHTPLMALVITAVIALELIALAALALLLRSLSAAGRGRRLANAAIVASAGAAVVFDTLHFML